MASGSWRRGPGILDYTKNRSTEQEVRSEALPRRSCLAADASRTDKIACGPFEPFSIAEVLIARLGRTMPSATARRSGDGVHRTLARRWSRVVLTLFAVGVITGTVFSFEMGLLWPNFTGTFGSVFGLGFAIEGFSFFVEAIFIGIYVYG